MLLGDILFIHGHTMPSTIRSSVERIVMGHLHPILLKPNNIVNGQRVWIYMKVRKKAIFSDSVGLLELIIMPSFDVGPGASFGHSRRKIISPILDRVVKNGDIEEMLYLTLDGSIVADLASLGDMPF
jgi:metallophosphoesterase superfamily enzyme